LKNIHYETRDTSGNELVTLTYDRLIDSRETGRPGVSSSAMKARFTCPSPKSRTLSKPAKKSSSPAG
jgi:hypothetical protein